MGFCAVHRRTITQDRIIAGTFVTFRYPHRDYSCRLKLAVALNNREVSRSIAATLRRKQA